MVALNARESPRHMIVTQFGSGIRVGGPRETTQRCTEAVVEDDERWRKEGASARTWVESGPVGCMFIRVTYCPWLGAGHSGL